jgi:hypothetical protein
VGQSKWEPSKSDVVSVERCQAYGALGGWGLGDWWETSGFVLSRRVKASNHPN